MRFCFIDAAFRATVTTQAAPETLRQDTLDDGRDEEGFDPHVHQASYCGNRVIGVNG